MRKFFGFYGFAKFDLYEMAFTNHSKRFFIETLSNEYL